MDGGTRKRLVVLISLFDGIGAAHVCLAWRVWHDGTMRKIVVIAEYASEIAEDPIKLRLFRRAKNAREYSRTSVMEIDDGGHRVPVASPRVELGDVRDVSAARLRKIVQTHGGNVDYVVIAGVCTSVRAARL